MNTCGYDNRRVRETRTRIKTVFLALMKKKQYTKISVRELTEAANINRSTFYKHYQDIYDLLDKTEDEIIEKMSDKVIQISRKGYIPGKHPQHTALFETMCENIDVCQILLSKNGDIDFMYKLIEALKKALRAAWAKECNDYIPAMYISYIAGGIATLYLSYIDTISNNLGDVAANEITPKDMGYFAGEVTNWIDEKFIKQE